MALEPGQIIDDKYRVIRLIGEGGMGAVYEGENARIRRRVAIKTLHSAIATNSEVVVRFEREAQAAGRIGSDHILEVLDLGALPNGDRYIVMEFLDGEPLSARIERFRQLNPGQLIPLLRQVLDGLSAAHAAGIIHRDLKPDNIFILRQKAGRADFVKLIDFGISKFSADQQSMAMTRTGTMMGTPLYMSPEQANGSAEADARSDIYAIGVILYEALTGQTPFTAKTFNELLFQIVLLDIPPVDQVVPGIDPGFAAIVAKAMARDRTQRFQSALEMWQAIEAWKQASGTRSERPPAPGGGFSETLNTEGMVPVRNVTPYPNPTPYPVNTPYPANTPYPNNTPSNPSAARVNTPYPADVSQPPHQNQTLNAWGASQPGVAVEPVRKPASRAPLFAALGVVGALLIGGVAIAVTRTSGSEPEKSPAAQPKVETTAKPQPTTKPETPAPEATSAAPEPSTTAPIASASVAPKLVPLPTGTAKVGIGIKAPPAPSPSVKKPKGDWGY